MFDGMTNVQKPFANILDDHWLPANLTWRHNCGWMANPEIAPVAAPFERLSRSSESISPADRGCGHAHSRGRLCLKRAAMDPESFPNDSRNRTLFNLRPSDPSGKEP